MEKKITNAKGAIRNIKFVFLSQVIVLLINVIRSIIIPKFIPVDTYGYWQTYLLYISYISVFCLGFNDGIYLKYAQTGKEGLKKNNFKSAFVAFGIILTLEMIFLLILNLLFIKSVNKMIFIFVILDIPVSGIFGTLTYYLQITENMKKYSICVVVEKIIFIITLIVALILGVKSPYIFMFFDILSVLLIDSYIIINERKYLVTFKPDIKKGFIELKNNILDGSKLMLGTYMYTFLNGICRMFISATQTVENFSYYSFAYSIANIVIVCISTVGTALYPHISKQEEKEYNNYYNYLDKFIKNVKPLACALYYLAYMFIIMYIPKYTLSLQYLGWLFIIIILQSKISIVNNTYYKVLRKEKKMLKDNLYSLIQLFIGCVLLKEIKLILILQVIVFSYRIVRTEIYFRKVMQNENKYNFFIESISIVIFIITLYLDFKLGFIVYIFYCIFFIIKNKKDYFNMVKILLKK